MPYTPDTILNLIREVTIWSVHNLPVSLSIKQAAAWSTGLSGSVTAPAILRTHCQKLKGQ